MKIFFICDLNSVHSRKWITHFTRKDHDVHVYSTTPFTGGFNGAGVYCGTPPAIPEPVAAPARLQSFLQSPVTQSAATLAEKIFVEWKKIGLRSGAFRHAAKVSELLRSIKPDIVHALRIPNEGFIGYLSGPTVPIAVSTWGNDLTYWARMRMFRKLTMETLRRADFLFADCERDINLGHELGFDRRKPHLVVPGAGGMNRSELAAGAKVGSARSDFFETKHGITGRPIFLSLRGFGSQDIDNEPLLHACRLLVSRGVDFKLIIAGKKYGLRFYKLERLIRKFALGERVVMIDEMPHETALDALKGADFSISISRNDGTPNSMLEAMTFGSIPIMENISSIREWIADGRNGYLLDPSNPNSIAETIQRAAQEKSKHDAMRKLNFEIVTERADYDKNMSMAEEKLTSLLRSR